MFKLSYPGGYYFLFALAQINISKEVVSFQGFLRYELRPPLLLLLLQPQSTGVTSCQDQLVNSPPTPNTYLNIKRFICNQKPRRLLSTPSTAFHVPFISFDYDPRFLRPSFNTRNNNNFRIRVNSLGVSHSFGTGWKIAGSGVGIHFAPEPSG